MFISFYPSLLHSILSIHLYKHFHIFSNVKNISSTLSKYDVKKLSNNPKKLYHLKFTGR